MGLGEKLRSAVEKLRNSTVVDRQAVKEAVKEIQRALIATDVEINLVLELTKKIEKEAFKNIPKGLSRREHVIKVTYDLLVEALGGEHKSPEKPKKILLVGLFGNGKTTTCAKLAKYYSKRGLKVGVICADSFRPAAYDQLKQLSEKIKIPFYGDKKEKNAAKIVEKGLKELKGHDLLIVDSAGRDALDKDMKKEIEKINDVFKPEQTWLVIGADVGQLAKKQAEAFHNAVGVNGVIITRMDGSAKGGGSLAACSVTKSPVYFLGTGEKVEDITEFDAQRYLSSIMGYGDLQALLEKVKEVEVVELDVEEMMKGKFTLKMFYDQLKAARKMGPLDKVMDMMGLKMQIPKDQLEIGEKKLSSFKIIIDSMTKAERENPEELLNRSRIERICKGAGRKVEEVRELLKHYKQMKKVFKQFNKLSKTGDMSEKGLQKMLSKMKGMKGMGAQKKKFKVR